MWGVGYVGRGVEAVEERDIGMIAIVLSLKVCSLCQPANCRTSSCSFGKQVVSHLCEDIKRRCPVNDDLG